MNALPRTILVVEDEAIIAADIQGTLESLGYRVPRVVASGADALAALDNLRPDLVLMDIRIQGDIDGIETARRIKARRDVPIVFLTSHSDQATLQRAKEAGPRAYLLKPFDEKDLRATIEVTLHTHELEQRLARAERFIAVAGLAGAIAHDLNNPLASLSGNLGYVRAQLETLLETCGPTARPALEELRDVVEDLVIDAQRMKKTVGDLTLLAEGDDAPRSVMPLEAAVRSGVAVVSSRVRARAKLDVSVDPTAQALATEGLVLQLTSHLVLRAASAGEGQPGHEVRVALERRGGAAVLRVTDNGRPLRPEDVRHMDLPLPPTTNYAELPGLTLALATRIAGELGATLSVEPLQPRGTQVEVVFPPVQ
jgi:CheY-like chemotaxis protein